MCINIFYVVFLNNYLRYRLTEQDMTKQGDLFQSFRGRNAQPEDNKAKILLPLGRGRRDSRLRAWALPVVIDVDIE